ncbi:MAG TPA: Tad domain-containing protein [Anaerolineales bacterium]|nr:Tad domain-containing protein [Anaerolineales bacterium]
MEHKLQERGQALILIVLAAVGLFAFAALAIDGSRVFSDRRHAQNAADTAVLAAALSKIRGGDYALAASKRADSNGYNNTNSTVEVHTCKEVADNNLQPPCVGLPTGADPAEYIQVVIRFITKTTFARIIGRPEVPGIVTAIARAQVGGTGSAGGTPAVAAFNPHDPDAILGDGNFTLNITNSGMFDNSDNGCAFRTNGTSGSYTVSTSYDVVGHYCKNGFPDLNPSTALNEGATQLPSPSYNFPVPSISCSAPSVLNGSTFSPGIHTNANIPNGTYSFASGDHCFPNGLKINGNNTITVEDGANFLISGGSLDANMNGNFNCTNTMIYVNGGSSVSFNGNGTNTCAGLTLYMATGSVFWGGNPVNNISAPSSGPYQGLLVYLPNSNKSDVTITGNSGSQFTGSIIATGSTVEIQGNSHTLALSTQIIGDKVHFKGGGDINIDYNPALVVPANSATQIQLTK